MQHVQIPTELIKKCSMKDCFIYAWVKRFQNQNTKTSCISLIKLEKFTGYSKKSIIESLNKIKALGYILISQLPNDKGGKFNLYSFKDYEKFEQYSVNFLDYQFDSNDKINRTIKEYIIKMQPHLYKYGEFSVTSFSDIKILKYLNVTLPTLRKYESILISHKILKTLPLRSKKDEAGFTRNYRIYNYQLLQQAPLFPAIHRDLIKRILTFIKQNWYV